MTYADEPSPVQIGAHCSETDAIYHLTSNIQKTPWQVSSLYAVPVGTLNPESWELSSSFHAAFIGELQSGQNVEEYAEACTAVWQDFFVQDTDVIVTLSRTISATDQVLECISGTWVHISTQEFNHEDQSDWLTINDTPFDVTNEASRSLLAAKLQNLINNLNTQPGAASNP
jgi:hypothetical protein